MCFDQNFKRVTLKTWRINAFVKNWLMFILYRESPVKCLACIHLILVISKNSNFSLKSWFEKLLVCFLCSAWTICDTDINFHKTKEIQNWTSTWKSKVTTNRSGIIYLHQYGESIIRAQVLLKELRALHFKDKDCIFLGCIQNLACYFNRQWSIISVNEPEQNQIGVKFIHESVNE